MATMTAEKLKQLWEDHPDELVEALQATLVDFGYTTRTPAFVRASIERYYKGKEAGGIIDRFIHGWLKNGID